MSIAMVLLFIVLAVAYGVMVMLNWTVAKDREGAENAVNQFNYAA